jgi:hypothetical protein
MAAACFVQQSGRFGLPRLAPEHVQKMMAADGLAASFARNEGEF